jgi:hypothetical protein
MTARPFVISSSRECGSAGSKELRVLPEGVQPSGLPAASVGNRRFDDFEPVLFVDVGPVGDIAMEFQFP